MLLSKRSRLSRDVLANKIGISVNYLTNAYRRPVLSEKIKARAIELFGVEESIFETGIGYDLPEPNLDRVGDAGEDYNTLQEEVRRLKAENARYAEEILREREVSKDLREALLLVAGKQSKK